MRPVLILLSSNVLGVIVGGLFFLAASRSFNLTEMGRYSVAISIQWVTVGLIGTGLSVAAIRVSSDYLRVGDRAAAAGVISLAFILAALMSLFLAGISLAVTHSISNQQFLSGPLLALVAIWAGARAMLDCLRSGLPVQRLYTRVGLLMVLSAVTGLASLGIVLWVDSLTLK